MFQPLKLQEVWFKSPARVRVEKRSVSVTHLEPGHHTNERDFKGFDLELRAEPLPHVAVLLKGAVAAEVPVENVASYVRGELAHVTEAARPDSPVGVDRNIDPEATNLADLARRMSAPDDVHDGPSGPAAEGLSAWAGQEVRHRTPQEVAQLGAAAAEVGARVAGEPERQLSKAERKAQRKAERG